MKTKYFKNITNVISKCLIIAVSCCLFLTACGNGSIFSPFSPNITELNQIEIDSEVYSFPLTGADLIRDGWKVSDGKDNTQIGQFDSTSIHFVNENGSEITTNMRNLGTYDHNCELFCSVEDARILGIETSVEKVKSSSIVNGVSLGMSISEAESLLKNFKVSNLFQTSDTTKSIEYNNDEKNIYHAYIYTLDESGNAIDNIGRLEIWDRSMPNLKHD